MRQGLIDIMQKSLYEQSYTNWKALWIGEKEFQDSKIKEVEVVDKKTLSEIYLRKDVIEYINDCDYIIKLDDDDIILPNTLQVASKLDFDCYCDAYHTFYDISSGIITQQKRNWIASTCIHKKEHAFKNFSPEILHSNFINSLFYGDHGRDWINYYKTKNIIYTSKENPVYVRVLSPTSITAGAKIFPVKLISNIDMPTYYNYLKNFGTWNLSTIKSFKIFQDDLRKNWESFSGMKQSKIPNIPFIEKLKTKIKAIFDD